MNKYKVTTDTESEDATIEADTFTVHDGHIVYFYKGSGENQGTVAMYNFRNVISVVKEEPPPGSLRDQQTKPL